MELGHRVSLPTRGTSFRLRICCRSPADPPLPPLPSCSIPPPFTAERRAGCSDCCSHSQPALLSTAPPPQRHFAGALFLYNPTTLPSDSSSLQSQGAADGRGWVRVVTPLTFCTARRDPAPMRCLPFSGRRRSALSFSAVPPIRKWGNCMHLTRPEM